MNPVKIKQNIDDSVFENLGYYYSIMEGGFISSDRATIIIDDREPYVGMVMQYKEEMDSAHINNVSKLRSEGLLE